MRSCSSYQHVLNVLRVSSVCVTRAHSNARDYDTLLFLEATNVQNRRRPPISPHLQASSSAWPVSWLLVKDIRPWVRARGEFVAPGNKLISSSLLQLWPEGQHFSARFLDHRSIT